MPREQYQAYNAFLFYSVLIGLATGQCNTHNMLYTQCVIHSVRQRNTHTQRCNRTEAICCNRITPALPESAGLLIAQTVPQTVPQPCSLNDLPKRHSVNGHTAPPLRGRTVHTVCPHERLWREISEVLRCKPFTLLKNHKRSPEPYAKCLMTDCGSE